MTISLKDFADAEGARRYSCSVCSLPKGVVAEVEAARKKDPPTSYAIISKWLRTHHDVSLTAGGLRLHFVNGHSA